MGIFLRAHWRNLAIITYRVPDAVLTPYLPRGCALDRLDGSAFASLVAFEFIDTRVLGVRWPGLTNFLEWNLRFYVRDIASQLRGVVFVREFVPSRLIASIARWRYNEPYEQAALSQTIAATEMRYGVQWRGSSAEIALGLTPRPERADDTTRDHFFKEHQWGFGTVRNGDRIVYEVTHPEWEILPVTHTRVTIEWAEMYGPAWSCLEDTEPFHSTFAVGSDVTVSYPER
jgi:uncharacterized protein